MPLLSNSEATTACDAFLITVYGEEIFRRWKELKSEMDFTSEREYMAWLIDVAYQYKSDELLMENNNAMFHMDPDLDDESKGMERSRDRISEKSDSNILPSEVVSSGAGDGMACVSAGGDSCVSGVAADNSYLNEKYSLESDTVMYLSDDEDDTQYVLQDEDTNGRQGEQLLTGVYNDALKHHCPFCPHKTRVKSHLNIHIRCVHERLRPFSCDHCQFQSATKGNLKQHLILKHNYGSSKHVCPSCGKGCVSRKKLWHHQRKCVPLRPSLLS